MPEERIAVGDFVRINPESSVHPRATDADIGANTAAFLVTAYDKVTKIATISRQGAVFGDYPEDALIKVDAPVDNTVEAPPDPLPGEGTGALSSRGDKSPLNPFPAKPSQTPAPKPAPKR